MGNVSGQWEEAGKNSQGGKKNGLEFLACSRKIAAIIHFTDTAVFLTG